MYKYSANYKSVYTNKLIITILCKVYNPTYLYILEWVIEQQANPSSTSFLKGTKPPSIKKKGGVTFTQSYLE